MRRPILAAALALGATVTSVAAPLRAQAPADSGARGRVHAPPLRGAYRVVGASSGPLLLRRDPASPVRRVAIATIQRLAGTF